MTILCVFAALSGLAIDLDADFGKKKIIFSDEIHFDFGGYVNKKNCRIIREAISEIQLHTSDNVLINSTDRVRYCKDCAFK